MPKRSEVDGSRGQFTSHDPGSAERKPRKPASKWDQEARAILRAEMARRGYSYKRLARELERLGEPESERSLISRVNRGTFSVAFMLRCLRAMGAARVSIDLDPTERPRAARSDAFHRVDQA